MTDEVQQAEMPDSGLAAPETPETEPVDTGATPDVAEDADSPETPEKPKGGFQRRIQELVEQRNEERALRLEERKQREAYQRRVDYLLERVLEREGSAAQPEAKPQPPTQPPSPDDFYGNPQGFVEAQNRWAEALFDARWQQKESERLEQQNAAARERQFEEREAKFAATKPDYMTVTRDPTLGMYSTPTIKDFLGDSEYGPELSYELATNREILESIARLPPAAQTRELARLEIKVSSAAKAPPPPPVSKAPPPPPKIEAVEPSVTKDPDQMDVDEWVKWRTKQLTKRSGR